MALGFFKKNIAADLILRDGVIQTQDPDLPMAEAIAVKDGLILAVGTSEEIAVFSGRETDEIDLAGAFLFPGFIHTHCYPVRELFADVSAVFHVKMSMDEALDVLQKFIMEHPDFPAYFGFGYDEAFFTSNTHIASKNLLDKVCSEKPVLLLSNMGQQAWANSLALSMAEVRAREDAEEAGESRTAAADDDDDDTPSYPGFLKDPLPRIQIFTRDEEGWPSGILIGPDPIFITAAAIHLFDADAFYAAAMEKGREYSRQGYTSLMDLGSPDFLNTFYMDLLQEALQENQLNQRYFGCLLNNKALNASLLVRHLLRKNTLCMECEDLLSFNTLHLVVESHEWESSIAEDALQTLCVEAGDRGCDVYIEAYGTIAISNSIHAFNAARDAGYKKNRFILTADEEIKDEELLAILQDTGAILDEKPSGDPQEWLDLLTTKAAYRIRMEDQLGTIAKGKYADFTILATDPLKSGGGDGQGGNPFLNAPVVMTVLQGQIVYQK